MYVFIQSAHYAIHFVIIYYTYILLRITYIVTLLLYAFYSECWF